MNSYDPPVSGKCNNCGAPAMYQPCGDRRGECELSVRICEGGCKRITLTEDVVEDHTDL